MALQGASESSRTKYSRFGASVTFIFRIRVWIGELQVTILFNLKVREKTKVVMDLLSNEKLIEEERESAKKIKERLNGI